MKGGGNARNSIRHKHVFVHGVDDRSVVHASHVVRSFSLLSCFSGCMERLFHWLPVPGCQLDRSLHQVPNGEGPAEGLLGDPEVLGDEVQDAERERETGEAAAVR